MSGSDFNRSTDCSNSALETGRVLSAIARKSDAVPSRHRFHSAAETSGNGNFKGK